MICHLRHFVEFSEIALCLQAPAHWRVLNVQRKPVSVGGANTLLWCLVTDFSFRGFGTLYDITKGISMTLSSEVIRCIIVLVSLQNNVTDQKLFSVPLNWMQCLKLKKNHPSIHPF